jgi:hypothetical protein
MASNIVPGNIDGTFPVAGQDNSSQGFRDNFTAIKNNFTDAKAEIEDLQNNRATTNANTSFNDYTVSRATFKDTAQTVYPHGTVGSGDSSTTTITLNHENGHYQTITSTDGNIGISFSTSSWPASGALGRIILDITYSNTTHELILPSNVQVASNVDGFDSDTRIHVSDTGRYLYEFLTTDGGTVILMHQLGKLYA